MREEKDFAKELAKDLKKKKIRKYSLTFLAVLILVTSVVGLKFERPDAQLEDGLGNLPETQQEQLQESEDVDDQDSVESGEEEEHGDEEKVGETEESLNGLSSDEEEKPKENSSNLESDSNEKETKNPTVDNKDKDDNQTDKDKEDNKDDKSDNDKKDDKSDKNDSTDKEDKDKKEDKDDGKKDEEDKPKPEPAEPNTPSKPDEPSTPDEPSEPDEPSTPDEPSKPDEPEEDVVIKDPNEVTVTISIRCDTLSSDMSKLENPAIAGYIPSNGVILATTTYKGTKDNTVFDVLNTVCRNKGIQLEFSYTPMYESYYIEGINYLYEFDGGPLSGWMYKVNGWFPNYGCSSYYLQDGDVIEWVYTCDLGADVGDNSLH